MKGKVLNLGKNLKKKGGEFETMLKRYFTILIAICIVGTIATISHAVEEEHSDFTLSILPSIGYNILIDTNGAAMDFGNMLLNAVKLSTGDGVVHPGTATVYNLSATIADWKISATPLDTWGLTPRAVGNTIDTVALDSACIAAILTSTDTSASDITAADFSVPTTTACVIGPYGVNGETNMDSGNFVSDTGGLSGNDVPKQNDPWDRRLLWIRVKTPNNSTVSGTQKFRIMISCWLAGEF